MTLEDIYEDWEKDGRIDRANISKESANIPFLHNKYFMKYSQEWLKLKKFKADHKTLEGVREDYYLGMLDPDELKARGWSPNPLSVKRVQLPAILEKDELLINSGLKIGYQEAIVEYLESIIKQINNRGFQLKTIVDFEKFQAGSN